MKKRAIFLSAIVAIKISTLDVHADFAGGTYTLSSPYSLYIATGSVTINNIVAAPYSTGTLIVSNASAGPVNVNWAAAGRAVGLGTTNAMVIPSGQIGEVSVNAVFPGLVTYTTSQETGASGGNPLTPDLLYYQMTEGAASYQTQAGFFENPPVYLTDSSTHGGSTGTVTATGIPIQWVPNQNGTPVSAVHFNGSSTALRAANPGLFSFTTNLFSVNLWVRNLTYPCALCGNGLYENSGWYIVINTAGEVVVAAESPGSDSYVATSSTVAFAGQWEMITVVRTGPKTVLIYRNALLQNTIGSFSNPAPTGNAVIFGDNYYGNQYDGDLGTIRIYGRPLAPNEINALYLNDTTP
jgi:hypothetical protein